MRGTVAKRLRRLAYTVAVQNGRPDMSRRAYRAIKSAYVRRMR